MIYFNSREHWGNTNSFIWTFSAIFPNFKKNLNNWYSPLLLFGNFPELSPERIHNHEVPSSILGPATRKYSRSLCFFRLYALKPCPEGAGHWRFWRRKLAFKAAEMTMDRSERSERWLEGSETRTAHRFFTQISWVPCVCTKGLEGAHRATETSWVPLLENQALTKVSWVLFWF